MDWFLDALKLLKTNFEHRVFTFTEANKLLREKKKYSRGTVKRILHELRDQASIEILGRGIYRIPENRNIAIPERLAIEHGVYTERYKVTDLIASPELRKARTLLKENEIEFMITGLSALSGYYHYIPHRLIHLIYVISGGGESAALSLQDNRLLALLNPKREEIDVILQTQQEKNIFIIREFAELKGKSDAIATIERAVMDLYFEVTRERIPFPLNEAAMIISNVFRRHRLNLRKLLMLASRRGIRSEIITLIDYLMPEVNLTKQRMDRSKERPNIYHNKYVTKIIEQIEVER